MNEERYEQTLDEIGKLQDRLQLLEDEDYMTAYYKGYSNGGQTLEEIKDEIDDLNERIAQLNREIDE